MSPNAVIEMGNFVHSTMNTGKYMTIDDDVGEFTFRKELEENINIQAKCPIVRSSVCVDDAKVSGKYSSHARVSKQGTAEVDRAKRDRLTAWQEWDRERNEAAACGAAEEAVAQFADVPGGDVSGASWRTSRVPLTLLRLQSRPSSRQERSVRDRFRLVFVSCLRLPPRSGTRPHSRPRSRSRTCTRSRPRSRPPALKCSHSRLS